MRSVFALTVVVVMLLVTGCRGTRPTEPARGPGFSESGEIYQNRD
jgi:hypothetical protein